MNKIISLIITFLSLSSLVSGQVRDTIYVYETITVYDTLIIRDTIRVNKPLTDTIKTDSSNIFTSRSATFSGQGIILHENNKNKKVMKLSTVKYLGAIILAAQTKVGLPQEPATPLQTFPMQFSVFYPMTTQGDKTINYHYNYSFNLLAGRVGAVTGIEFGGLYNRVENDVTGVQFAGLMNKSSGVTGVQNGGLANAANTVNGAQSAGLTNVAKDVTGIQFAGIANFADSIKGMQFGGIANFTKSVTGMQFSSITNLTEKSKGFQFVGIYNRTNESAGFQFAGIVNVNNKVEGAQFAGITNINNKIEGASFGGIFNRTGSLRGVQFGVVNVIDTVESGVSIALLSIVKKSFYDEWALTFADYQNVGISYKMGMQKFYTIYTAGYNFIEDKLWSFGVGFGSRKALNSKIDFQPEVVAYNYHQTDFKKYNHLWSAHLKLGFVYNISPKLGIAVTPSVYQLSMEQKAGQENRKVSPVSAIYSREDDSWLNNVGVGLSIGLILR